MNRHSDQDAFISKCSERMNEFIDEDEVGQFTKKLIPLMKIVMNKQVENTE